MPVAGFVSGTKKIKKNAVAAVLSPGAAPLRLAAKLREMGVEARFPAPPPDAEAPTASLNGHAAPPDVAAPNALPNRKYFGTGRGVTYFSITSDQFTGLHGMAVPGTMRDSQ